MSEFSLKIGGYTFSKFTKFALGLNYNGVASVFSFEGFFDINNPDHKRLFKPLTYPTCQVLFNNKVILTGTILSYSSAIAGESFLTGISGYSLPGVLEDCEIPLEVYPLEFDNMNLKQITEKIIAPFGIKLVIDESSVDEVNTLYPDSGNTPEALKEKSFVEKIFDKAVTFIGGDEETAMPKQHAKENEKVKEYICNIAKQKHIIVTHNSLGNLVFTRLAVDKQSIATFTENKPSNKISLTVNGQELHSKIDLQGQSEVETDVPTKDMVENPLVKSYRPSVKQQTSGDNKNMALTAKMARGAELKAIQLTIETNEWIWFDGRRNHMILPNSIIDVVSPSNYLSKKSRWFVESVELTGDETRSTAVIKAVLPEVYTGETPKYIFS